MDLNNLINKLFRKRVELVRYPSPMSVEEIKKSFSGIGAGDKFWQGLDTIIDSLLLDFVSDVADPKIVASSELLAHASGRVDAMATLKSQLEEFKPDGSLRVPDTE
jgi:hypothetical protein